MENFIHWVAIFTVNSIVVALTVVIHYEFLFQLNRCIPRLAIPVRYRIVAGVLGTLVAHAVEIWVFAAAFFWMHHTEGWGRLVGPEVAFIDCVYYSFTVYSTLGFGDIVPEGDLRYLTGIEALVGLVMITWSASFLYLEMQKDWKVGGER